MTMLPPSKIYQFTNNVPQGDRHDAQFANHDAAIVSTQEAVSDIRRSDGALKNEIVTLDSLHPNLIAQITDDFAQSIEDEVAAIETAMAITVAKRDDAILANANAQVAAADAFMHAQTIAGGAGSALAVIENARHQVEVTYAHSVSQYNTIINATNEAVGAEALASEWADVSYHWAEYMPGTIPPNILATMGITGDHWSSRWWANYADQKIAEWEIENGVAQENLDDFNDIYLGPHATPPATDNDGDALQVGAMYWNETDSTMYVWSGTSWIPMASSGGGGGGTGDITNAANMGTGAGVFAQKFGDLLQFKSLKFDSAFALTVTADEIQVAFTGTGSVSWGSITGVPTTIAGYGITDAYTKTQTDTALAGKANTVHAHVIADTTGLQTALDGKAPTVHAHAIADTTGLQAALDAKATTTDLANKVAKTGDTMSGPLVLGVGGTVGARVDLLINGPAHASGGASVALSRNGVAGNTWYVGHSSGFNADDSNDLTVYSGVLGNILRASITTGVFTFVASPTAPTPTLTDDTTKLATTAFVQHHARLMNNIASTAYTFVLADGGAVVIARSTAATVFTIPPFSAVAFPLGTQIDLIQANAGQLAIAPGAGVTLASEDNRRKLTKYCSTATLINTGSDIWVLSGSLVA